jgi:hypothetical protein
MSTARCVVTAVSLLVFTTACKRDDDSNVLRGRGLELAPLSDGDRVSVYNAALRAAFDMDDPALSLLLDPNFLPRTSGVGSGTPVPASLASLLRDRGVVKGTCSAPASGTRKTLLCRAERPGYVVRFSDVFTLSRDSVQVYVLVQKYDTPESGATEAMRFEKAYQVVRHDGVWQAAREGRMPRPR